MTEFYMVAECTCKKPHKNGKVVVRFVHSNKREWPCRLCPHFETVADAIDGAKRHRNLRRFVLENLQQKGA